MLTHATLGVDFGSMSNEILDNFVVPFASCIVQRALHVLHAVKSVTEIHWKKIKK